MRRDSLSDVNTRSDTRFGSRNRIIARAHPGFLARGVVSADSATLLSPRKSAKSQTLSRGLATHLTGRSLIPRSWPRRSLQLTAGGRPGLSVSYVPSES